MDEITRIPVGGEQAYDVVVGRGLTDQIAALLPGADRVAVLASAPLAGRAGAVEAALRAEGRAVTRIEIPDAESGKTIETAAACWDRLGAAGFTRSDAVVAVGGGAATDLGGYVAAAWLRGVRWVPVSTSLLGMVDAAVGGKTGVNTAAGKNLVGAFHPPAGVLCDLDSLDSLPPADLTAGLAEVVKCGFIAEPAILDLIERDPAAATDPAGPAVRRLIEYAVRVKADVVGGDLKESGRREILNYGHTLAHAIEKVEHYTWRHGDAVSVGLVYAAQLSHLAGRLDRPTADRHRAILTALGLPTTYSAAAWPDLLAAMRVDKKARGSRLRFIVLDALAETDVLDGPSDDLLAEAFATVSD
ncbi:3-dehydroquinate synthase [Asanoa sp. WMMD1127]|uniref:3-dehydroquinate synthase n=1 Tax=Asanoa sp. WMMD1127 TaxID=3016107 RepID=UPI002416139D|nr:3-dehydroquinate synthase [Asanoa sp. WMMD1127]MDG4824452.1 3-dehydroquinate synthase [Asanoa sp. WMMD1127]